MGLGVEIEPPGWWEANHFKETKMYVCSCRKISTHDHKTRDELIQRLIQGDHRCGKCIIEIDEDIKKQLTKNVDR